MILQLIVLVLLFPSAIGFIPHDCPAFLMRNCCLTMHYRIHGSDHASNDEISSVVNRIESLFDHAMTRAVPSSDPHSQHQESLDAIKVAFKASHSRKIIFNNTERAIKYLSLPTSNYSVLDNALVERIGSDENSTFLLSLPLGDFTAAFGAIGSSPGDYSIPSERNPIFAQMSISVQSNPAEGIIHMKSGPVFLRSMNHSNDANDSSSSIGKNNQVPAWLVWGGHSQINISDSSTWNIPVNGSNEEQPSSLKSSVQPGISIRLKWRTPGELSHLQRARRWFALPAKDQAVDHLVVHAKVDLHMEAHVALHKPLAMAMSFLPLRLLVQQAGSLVMSLVLKSIAPRFVELLMEDYNTRAL